MKRSKILISFVLIVLLLLGIYYYFSWQQRQQTGNGAKIVLSGTIEGTDVLVGSKVPGRLKEVPFHEGDRVKTGQLVASLEDSEFSAQLNQAQAALAQARANYQDARADRDRNQPLYRQGIISDQQFEKVTTRFKAAGAALDQAKAARQFAQTQFDNTKIFSPLDGTVTQRLTEPGEIIGAGSPVAAIVNLNNIWVKVYVPEPQVGKVTLGDSAEVSVDSFPKTAFKGKITTISSEAEFTPKNIQTKQERVQLVFGVKVAIDNQEGRLKPGMPADVVIHFSTPAK